MHVLLRCLLDGYWGVATRQDVVKGHRGWVPVCAQDHARELPSVSWSLANSHLGPLPIAALLLWACCTRIRPEYGMLVVNSGGNQQRSAPPCGGLEELPLAPSSLR